MLEACSRSCAGTTEATPSFSPSNPATRARNSGRDTAIAAVATIRGPVAAFDAVVYLTMAFLARSGYPLAREWERDNSSREVAARTKDCLAPTK